MRHLQHLRLLQAIFAGVLLVVTVWSLVLLVATLGQTPTLRLDTAYTFPVDPSQSITTGIEHLPIAPIPTSALPPTILINYYYPNNSSGHSFEDDEGADGFGGGVGGRRRSRSAAKLPKGLSEKFVKAYASFTKLKKLSVKLKAHGKEDEDADAGAEEKQEEEGENKVETAAAGAGKNRGKKAKKALKKAAKATEKALQEWWQWMGEQGKVKGMLKKEKKFGMKMAKKLHVTLEAIAHGRAKKGRRECLFNRKDGTLGPNTVQHWS